MHESERSDEISRKNEGGGLSGKEFEGSF